MIQLFTGQFIAIICVTAFCGVMLGIIFSSLLDGIAKARPRPMATRLPRPRPDCVVRADPYVVSPGRGR